MQSSCALNSPNANAELKEFISKSKVRLQAILQRLQWTEEGVLRDFNSNSKATRHDYDTVDESHEGTSAEPELPTSCATKNSIKLAESELKSLVKDGNIRIPKKFSDIQVNFTREQKLCIYDHVVERTGSFTEPEVQVPALNEGQLSFAEIVAEKKREKKNKRRHRTSKPTHIEEVRGLVELQMQALQQYMEARAKEESNKNYEYMCKRNRDTGAGKSRRDQSNMKYNRKRSNSGSRISISRQRNRSRSRNKSPINNEIRRRKYDRSRSRQYKEQKRHSNRSNRNRSRAEKEHKYDERKRSSSRSRNHVRYKKHARSRSNSRSRHDNAYRKRSESQNRRRKNLQRSEYASHRR